MAIKDQCINCRLFNGNICQFTNFEPNYNQTSCEQYVKRGINLDKGNGNQVSAVSQSAGNSDVGNTATGKQGMFQAPFSFKGRIRRLEYGLSCIAYMLYYYTVGFMIGISGSNRAVMFLFLLIIPAYWFLLAQGAKRCHDRGNSGWFQLIPFYGLWMLFGDGDRYENEYGPDPKRRNVSS